MCHRRPPVLDVKALARRGLEGKLSKPIYLLFCKHILDRTDNRQHNNATKPARNRLSNQDTAIRASCGLGNRSTAQIGQDLTAQTATYDPGNRIPQKPKIDPLKKAASQVAANSPDNQAYQKFHWLSALTIPPAPSLARRSPKAKGNSRQQAFAPTRDL